jgi:hypothetical protein
MVEQLKMDKALSSLTIDPAALLFLTGQNQSKHVLS